MITISFRKGDRKMNDEQFKKLRSSLIINRILLILVLIILLALIGGMVYITKAAVPYVEEFKGLMDLLAKLDVSAINGAVTDAKESMAHINELGDKINSIIESFEAFADKLSPILSFFGN